MGSSKESFSNGKSRFGGSIESSELSGEELTVLLQSLLNELVAVPGVRQLVRNSSDDLLLESLAESWRALFDGLPIPAQRPKALKALIPAQKWSELLLLSRAWADSELLQFGPSALELFALGLIWNRLVVAEIESRNRSSALNFQLQFNPT